MNADLHIHTNASDGVLTPGQIVLEAKQHGLTHIAITDHDTVDGLKLLLNQPQHTENFTIIPGIEFSTDLPEHEVHLLGYYIDIHNPELLKQLNIMIEDRFDRIVRMVATLNKLGYSIELSRVIEIAGNATTIGRPHVASSLVEKGYFSSIAEVFDRLLYKNGPAYVPHYKLSPHETIHLIKYCGGIPVLAHPGLIGNDEIVMDLIHNGLRGLEVFHPAHDDKQIKKYRELAAQYKLLITGGSDFHGFAHCFPEKIGEFVVSADYALALKKAWEHEMT